MSDFDQSDQIAKDAANLAREMFEEGVRRSEVDVAYMDGIDVNTLARDIRAAVKGHMRYDVDESRILAILPALIATIGTRA